MHCADFDLLQLTNARDTLSKPQALVPALMALEKPTKVIMNLFSCKSTFSQRLPQNPQVCRRQRSFAIGIFSCKHNRQCFPSNGQPQLFSSPALTAGCCTAGLPLPCLQLPSNKLSQARPRIRHISNRTPFRSIQRISDCACGKRCLTNVPSVRCERAF